MVDETVDHGGGYHWVAEDFAPSSEGFVGGDDCRGPLVAGRDELEEEVGGFGFEGDVLGRGRDAWQVFACWFSRPRPPNRTCTFPRIRLSA